MDNSGALSCLVYDSASVHQTDYIVGETWIRHAALGVLPWSDRADTHSNPSDGLSRGKFEGPWDFQKITLSDNIFALLKAQ